MKNLIGAFFMLFLTGAPAFALRNAQPMDPQEIVIRDRIAKGIKAVKVLQDRVDLNFPEDETKNGVKHFRGKINDAENGINSIDPKTKADIARWKAKIAIIRAQQEILCRPILQDAIDLYQIRPDPPSVKILEGPLAGLKSTWNPVVGDPSQARKLKDAKNHEVIAGGCPNAAGCTSFYDGGIIIDVNAFLYTPALLGVAIAHETVHWGQMTDRRRNERNTMEREILAYTSMAGPATDDIFGLIQADRDEIAKRKKEQLQKMSLDPRNFRPGLFSGPGEPEPLRKGGEDSFASGVAQLEQITKVIKDYADKEAKKRAEEAEQRKNKDAFASVIREGYRCGFEPILSPDNHINGFASMDHSEGLRYVFTSDMKTNFDQETIKAQLLLVRACADADAAGMGVGQPCNDAQETINRRWSDKDFRTILSFNTSPEQKACLDLLRDRLKTPASPERINELLKRFVKEKEVRKEKERKRQEKEGRKNAPSKPSEPDQPKAPNPKKPEDPYRGPCNNLGSNC